MDKEKAAMELDPQVAKESTRTTTVEVDHKEQDLQLLTTKASEVSRSLKTTRVK